LDIIGLNEYYGWYDPDYNKLSKLFKNSSPNKPVFITEFGGDAQAGYRGSIEDFFSEDRQNFIYEKQIPILTNTPYVRGLSPWILYDFKSPRRTNNFQEGYNRKGLIAEDKKTKKMAYSTVQELYKRLSR